VTGVSGVFMAWLGMGVWSLTFSGLLGGLLRNILLSFLTPLRLQFNFNIEIMKKHGAYGSKIVANDFVSHMRKEALKLMLSKLAGPTFLGLFNKADSLHRLPYWMFAQPVAQPVFRGMAKVQDDLDQTKYMFYRVITLLGVYILPFYVVMRWIAEPFILVVYGEKWVDAGEPMAILALSGFFYIIARPCGMLLMAQNRLMQELLVQGIILCFTLAVCYLGLQWGLIGVSWGFLASQAFAAVCLYALAYRTIPTKLADLFRALLPGVQLNTILFAALALTDFMTGDLRTTTPALYVLAMVLAAGLVYPAAFLFIPIRSLENEVARWKNQISGMVKKLSA
jgi:O-antigen/teichoic acid export membrane protein